MSFYLSAVVMGVLSGGHCLGMCGPLVLALPVNEKSFAASLLYRVIYNGGRIFTYVLLGSLTGAFGMALALRQVQSRVALIAGVLIIIISVLQLLPFVHSAVFSRLHAAISRFFSRVLQQKGPQRYFAVGMVNGFLPCGMVAAALVAGAASASVGEGALYMLFFGLGTFPLMLAASVFGIYLSRRVRSWLAVLGPLYGVALGVLLILRPGLLHPHCH